MGAAMALALFSLAVLALGNRAHRPLHTAGGVAVRVVLLLIPPAARNSMALLNCASAAVSPAGCASLNGCSGGTGSNGDGGRGRLVAVSLLASNPYYVCWATGGAHYGAGGLAVAALAVAVVTFPIAFLYAAYTEQWVDSLLQRNLQKGQVGDDTGKALEASAVVFNPLRLRAATAEPAAGQAALPAEGSHTAAGPLLAPFLSDYRPAAWYTRHADLALTLLLAALQVLLRVLSCRASDTTHELPIPRAQAFVPTPASKATLLAKAAVIITSMLALTVHTLWVRPFTPLQAWKGPVRAALLVLAAASAAVVAWAGALDLRIISGTAALKALTAGSYALAVLFCAVIAVLVASVAAAMLRGVREEQARIHATESLPQHRRRVEPRIDKDLAGSVGMALVHVPESIACGEGRYVSAAAAASASAAGLDSTDDSAYSMNPLAVRRRMVSRKKLQPKLSKQDASLAFAAVVLLDAASSDADVVAVCDNIASSLGRLTSAKARAASATLLPGLAARITAALSSGAVADSAMVVAVCRAMSALSDHADAATLSGMAESGAVEQLMSLLRQCVPGQSPGSSPASAPPALAPALVLLGNVAADKRAAKAFVAAGGAGLLVALLSSVDTTASCADKDSAGVVQPAGQPSGDSLLLICVAAASVSEHAGAATALLRAGVVPVLARSLLPQPLIGSGAAPHSFADAEAACRALTNVLRHCAASAEDADEAASELAACGAVAGCTAALKRAASEADALVVDLAACIAEALVGIVECAAAAGHAASSALAVQVAAGETEAAVIALIEAAPEKQEEGGEAAIRRRALENLLMQLRSWLGSAPDKGREGALPVVCAATVGFTD